MGLAQNQVVISIRITLTLMLALVAELLIFFHLLLILYGEGAELVWFLQVFLPFVGIYTAYSFSLLPRDRKYAWLRASLLANPAGTVIFAGLSFIFISNSVLSLGFAIIAGIAFVVGLWLLVKYFGDKNAP